MTKENWKKIRGSGVKPDHIMLSVNGDASNTITVKWRNSTDVKKGYALYRKAGSQGEWMRAEAMVNYFETDVDESNYFFANMNGLLPDTRYEYTVGDNNFRSELYTFKSARKSFSKFTFLCLSDVQSGGPEPPADYTVLNTVIKKVLSLHPQIEFILTAGDNTNCGQTDVQWTGLMEGLKGICESVPIMFCMGNHDDMGFKDYYTFTGKYYSEKATYFSNQLKGSYPDNGPEGWKVTNYSFDYGNAHFAVMGTSGYEDINNWLLADAASSQKKWKFGAHHFPVCYSGPSIENEDTWPALKGGMELLDLVFSGHEHSFARSYPLRDFGLYNKPSQGTIHYNLGSGSRNPPGTRVVDKVWNAKTYAHEEDLSMYTIAEVDGDVLTLTAYVEDGRIADKCVIDKKNDVILPYDCAPIYNKTRIKFKGYDLGMCSEATLPQLVNGLWYIAPGQLINFIGGDVLRTVGKIRVDVYGRFSEFTENSDVMHTNAGDIKMKGACLRLNKDQLYVPIDDFCSNLRMHSQYYEHNNFITVESDTEALPIPNQP